MRRQLVALGQFAAGNALTDGIRQTLINWSIVVRQFQIFEHYSLGAPGVLVFSKTFITWRKASHNQTCMHALMVY